MRLKRLATLVAAAVMLGRQRSRTTAVAGRGDRAAAADPTLPYLPAVSPLICPGGEPACLTALATELGARTDALGCDAGRAPIARRRTLAAP